MKIILFPITVSALLLCAMASSLLAQSDEEPGLPWSALDGGCGDGSGGDYALNSSVGQFDAVVSGGDYSVASCAFGLPLVAPDPGEAPTLIIQRSGSQMLVSWSPAGTGYVLQVCDDLVSGNWVDAPNGGTSPAAFLANAATQFFRLRSP